MTNNLSANAYSLIASMGDLLCKLQIAREVDVVAFELIEAQARELARELKGNEQLPRLLLQEWYLTIQTLRNEAPYFSEREKQLTEMANQLEFTFALILRGESHDDRVSGVPRII
ncbi:hypothetical protein ACTSKR_05510 [Chitinibacteraceae bacterium HSL-7]